MSIASREERRPKGKVPAKVLRGHRAIWGGKIPPGALEQLKKEYSKKPKRNRSTMKKKNAPKMKRTAPKGWIKAKGVKIRRRGGRVEILIRK